MSDHVWPVLGVVDGEFGDAIEVAHDPASRELRIGILHLGEEEGSAWLSQPQRDALRELLDRAALPRHRVKHGPGCQCTPCKAAYPAGVFAALPGGRYMPPILPAAD